MVGVHTPTASDLRLSKRPFHTRAFNNKDTPATTVIPSLIPFQQLSFTTITMSSSAAARARVFAAYRKCFRTRKQVFQNDDFALQQSRATIREEFGKNRNVAATGQQFDEMIKMADEAVDFLKFSVMQAQLDEKTGNYGTNKESALLTVDILVLLGYLKRSSIHS